MPEAPWAPTLSSCYCLRSRGPTDTCVTGCRAGRCVCGEAGIQLLERRARFSSLPLGPGCRVGRGVGTGRSEFPSVLICRLRPSPDFRNNSLCSLPSFQILLPFHRF